MKWKLYGLLGFLVVIFALGVCVKIYNAGKEKEAMKNTLKQAETINENIKIIDDSKDIKRPSDIVYRERLLQFTKD
jgi:large-conductance mechanosensitive channel